MKISIMHKNKMKILMENLLFKLIKIFKLSLCIKLATIYKLMIFFYIAFDIDKILHDLDRQTSAFKIFFLVIKFFKNSKIAS